MIQNERIFILTYCIVCILTDTTFSLKKSKDGKTTLQLSGKGKTTWILTSESEDEINKWAQHIKEILIKIGTVNIITIFTY